MSMAELLKPYSDDLAKGVFPKLAQHMTMLQCDIYAAATMAALFLHGVRKLIIAWNYN